MIRAIMLSFNEGGEFVRVLCRWLLQTYILFKANDLECFVRAVSL